VFAVVPLSRPASRRLCLTRQRLYDMIDDPKEEKDLASAKGADYFPAQR